MANCTNCGAAMDAYSVTCRNCGAYQVAPGDSTQPQQPQGYYQQGQYPGQYGQGQYPSGYPGQPYPTAGQQPTPPPQKNGLLPVVIGLAVLLVLVIGGIAAFALLGGDDSDNTATDTSTSASTSESESTASASITPTTPTAPVTQTVTPRPTVTVTKKPKVTPRPTVTVTKEPDPVETQEQSSAIDCGNDIWADGTASCPFAGNVAQAWYDSGGASTLYDVYSPVTDQYYDLDCWGSQPVTCTVGRAIIFFYEQ